MAYYDHLTLSEKVMRMNIHLQALAVHNPKRIVTPPGFVPHTVIDKRIAELLKKHQKKGDKS